jgi:branched-subunit amino acid transport protein
MSGTALVTLVAAGAVGTFLLRASFLWLVPGERLPAPVKRGLRYVAPAVLAALAVPAFVPSAWPPEGMGSFVRPIAAAVAVLVAWRFGNIFLTIGTGMATLWTLNALF